jgi:hypothetical protein
MIWSSMSRRRASSRLAGRGRGVRLSKRCWRWQREYVLDDRGVRQNVSLGELSRIPQRAKDIKGTADIRCNSSAKRRPIARWSLLSKLAAKRRPDFSCNVLRADLGRPRQSRRPFLKDGIVGPHFGKLFRKKRSPSPANLRCRHSDQTSGRWRRELAPAIQLRSRGRPTLETNP